MIADSPLREKSVSSRTKTLAMVASALIVVCGIALRAHGMSKSLWLDEAWVANSTLENTLSETLYHSTWVQTSPAGFLVLVRRTNKLLKLSNTSLRVVPFLSGVVALICMAYLSFRLLPPLAATWSATLFSFSPLAIYFSHSLKQYSSELMCSVLLLTAVWSYIAEPSARRYFLLVVITILSLVCSYGVIYFLPGLTVLLYPFGQCWRELDRKLAVMRWRIFAVTVSVTAVVVYFAFVRPNRSSNLMLGFWAERRLDGPHMLIKYLSTRFQQILEVLLPIPVEFERLSRMSGLLWACGFLAFAICGIVFVDSGDRTRRFFAFMCASPCALAVLLDLLHVYPIVFNGRTSLILLPCVALAFASCLGVVVQEIPKILSKGARWNKSALGNRYASSAAAFAIVITSFVGVKAALRNDPMIEDMASAVRYLSRSSSASDFVFVHASSEEALRLYARMYEWRLSSNVRFGNTGWPCCIRSEKSTRSTPEEALQDFISNIPAQNSGQAWLLATQRKGHWDLVGFDESAMIASVFISAGCEDRPVEPFIGVRLRHFVCGRNMYESVRQLDRRNN